MASLTIHLSSNALQERPSESWHLTTAINLTCPECRNDPANIIDEYSSGDTVCGDCGLVLGARIVDTRSEWRTFTESDSASGVDPNRVGEAASPLLNGSQLTTHIGSKPGEQGNILQRAHRLSNTEKVNHTLRVAYAEIAAFAAAISITTVVSDAAKMLYKFVIDNKGLRGHSRQAIIAGCIFIACRQGRVPRTFTEIFALTKIRKKEIARTFRALEALIRKKTEHRKESSTPAEKTIAPTADALVVRYASALALDPSVGNAAKAVAMRVDNVGILLGRSPITCAAAILYMVSWLMGVGLSMEAIGKVTGVTEASTKQVYSALWRHKALYLEAEWVNSVGGDTYRLPVPTGGR